MIHNPYKCRQYFIVDEGDIHDSLSSKDSLSEMADVNPLVNLVITDKQIHRRH